MNFDSFLWLFYEDEISFKLKKLIIKIKLINLFNYYLLLIK